MKIIQAGIRVSLFCFLVLSCSGGSKVVARVGDIELTENEAFVLMEHLGYDIQSDSAYTQFLNEWINEQVFLAALNKNKPKKALLTELRAKKYQAELAKFYFEDNYYKTRLDTAISESELTEFYEAHKSEFILHDYIVKALYLKIPSHLDFQSKKIQQKYLLKNDKDLLEVNSYAKLYAANFYHNDSSWIYFSDLSKDIPLERYNTDNIILNRTKTYFSDDNFTYFLNIIDYKLKDEAPPLDFLREELKTVILEQRLQTLKEKSGGDLLKELKLNHEIYLNP